MENKIDLRVKAKNIRKGLDMENISRKLCENIRNLDEYKKAKHVLIFYPLENEVDTLDLISEDKNFYLPRIKYEDLEICPYKLGDELNSSSFKTKEPLTTPVSPEILDIIIVPALMADKNNYRLGYGKGFYDRLLLQTSATTILPIPKELVIEKLSIDSHDKKVDIVMTI